MMSSHGGGIGHAPSSGSGFGPLCASSFGQHGQEANGVFQENLGAGNLSFPALDKAIEGSHIVNIALRGLNQAFHSLCNMFQSVFQGASLSSIGISNFAGIKKGFAKPGRG